MEADLTEVCERLLVTEKQAARLLGICERKLWDMRHDGLIPYLRVGRSIRYSISDLENWIAAKRQVGVAQ
jgi:excisionase family DNA binding protein